ncbi:hypothetical protein ABPG74_010154 [Tetrahymena malaccensis]
MKALDGSNLNRFVAIKLQIITDSDILKDSIQEYQNCLLVNHPNVIKIYQQLYDEENQCYFTVSEFCELGNLYNYFFKNNLTQLEILQICIQLIEGITAIHEKNIVHSDLKPQNILISTDSQIKICDLGISQQQLASTSHIDAQGGSIDYMAPEQVEGRLSKQCDTYAIGCIICFLCKVNIFGLNALSIKRGIFPSLEQIQLKELACLAFKLMDIDPSKRICLKNCLIQLKQFKSNILTDLKQQQQQQQQQGDFVNDKRQGYGIREWNNGSKYEGYFKNDKMDGKGIIYYSEQDLWNRKKYEGDFVNGKRQGYGILEWKNGDKYEGYFKNDKIDGKGIIYYHEQDQWNRKKYEGNFVNGKRQGFCIIDWKNGDKYEGYFKNDQFDGKGIIYQANGDKYDGYFKNSFPHGKGIFYSSNGQKLDGYYKNGFAHGKVIIYYEEQNLFMKYEGDIMNNIVEGYGYLEMKNGDKYEGYFKNNKINGKGIYYYSEQDQYNRKMYKGSFVNGRAEGFGILDWKNGDKYIGDFKNNKLEGKGILYYDNSEKYDGYFKNGKRDGKGIYHYKDGKYQERKYLNGTLLD